MSGELSSPLLAVEECDAGNGALLLDAAAYDGVDDVSASFSGSDGEDDDAPCGPLLAALRRCRDGLAKLLLVDSDTLGQYARVFAVECLLLIGYLVTRLTALTGVPSDAASSTDGGLVASDFGQLLQLGAVLAWLTDVHLPQRFSWLCSRPLLLALYFSTLPVYSLLNEVPGLQVSLSTIPQWGPVAWVTMLSAGAALTWAVVWHVRYSASLPQRLGIAYIACRAGIVAFFLFQWLLMRASAPGRLHEERYHLHHYWIGFLVAIWGCFNHPTSAVVLTIGAAVMTQGIAAYHAAALFEATTAGRMAAARRAGCVTMTVNGSEAVDTHAVCLFSASARDTQWGLWACPAYFTGDTAPNVTCLAGTR
jgi:hypothetical protein